MTERSRVEYVDFRPEAREAWLMARKFESIFNERIDRIVTRQDDVSLSLCDALSTDNISYLTNYYETTDEVMRQLEELLIDHEDKASQKDSPRDAVVYTFPSRTTSEHIGTFDNDSEQTLSKLSLVKRLK